MITKTVRRLHAAIFSHPYVHFIASRALVFCARALGCNLLEVAHRSMGIGLYENAEVSGEGHLIHRWLPAFFSSTGVTCPTVFDVGANVGRYSELLSSTFPCAQIYAFEPHPSTYQMLSKRVAVLGNVSAWNLAASAHEGSFDLWSDADANSSEHASAYRDVLATQHHYKEMIQTQISATSLDKFCATNQVAKINFLKIDTEGHELEVLRGACNLLKEGRIEVIQFEFNEMNIISRVFLKDFLDLLEGFVFYRLLQHGPRLLQYSSRQEVFVFQNLLAVRQDLNKTKLSQTSCNPFKVGSSPA